MPQARPSRRSTPRTVIMRRILSSILHTVVLATCLAAWPVAAQNQQSEIRTMLESRDAEIKRLLGRTDSEVSPQRREQLRDVINSVIDFEAMSRGALGPHWNDLSAAQRTGFVTVFGSIIRGQSLSNLDPYRQKVTYDAIEVDGNTARVVTSTTVKDARVTVAYDMTRGEGGWHVTDVSIDDVSTVEGYARSFQSMIRKRGFDALMQRLREKLAEVEAEG
jgi:phospholipid transport system substrate-binding protein